jgi:hypothetical protein
MKTHNRSQLISDLNETALGLIAESELALPEKAYELKELAGTLDKLRVSLLQRGNYPRTAPHYLNVIPANCA